jgi:hypothetical protein
MILLRLLGFDQSIEGRGAYDQFPDLSRLKIHMQPYYLHRWQHSILKNRAGRAQNSSLMMENCGAEVSAAITSDKNESHPGKTICSPSLFQVCFMFVGRLPVVPTLS